MGGSGFGMNGILAGADGCAQFPEASLERSAPVLCIDQVFEMNRRLRRSARAFSSRPSRSVDLSVHVAGVQIIMLTT